MVEIDWNRDREAMQEWQLSKPRTKKLRERLEEVIILVDEREQEPWEFERYRKVRLETGDYSFVDDDFDFRDLFVVERKASPSELLAAMTSKRKAFVEELKRLREVPSRAIVCEFSWNDLLLEVSNRKMSDTSVFGTLVSWMLNSGVPVIFAGSREAAKAIFWKGVELSLKDT